MKEINFTEIKKQIRNILRRKNDRMPRVLVMEIDNEIMVLLNDKEILKVRKTSEYDKTIIENIMYLLVQQVLLQKRVNKNKDDVYRQLELLNNGVEELDELIVEVDIVKEYYDYKKSI